jgi:hypothetical protein
VGDDHRVDFLIDYVGGTLADVRNALHEGDCELLLLKLCEKTERNKHGLNNLQKKILNYGPVRGNYTIQLAARFGIIHPKWESFARIVKGKNRFYKCVNHHLRRQYAHDLSTKEAEDEVEAAFAAVRTSVCLRTAMLG